MALSLRTKFLAPLLVGGCLMATTAAWVSYQAATSELRAQIVKRSELLATALSEAVKATASDDEIRFAVEEIVGKESSVYGIAVATRDPLIIWASSFRPGTDEDALTQDMLTTLRASLRRGTFGHHHSPDGDLITLMPLGSRNEALDRTTVAPLTNTKGHLAQTKDGEIRVSQFALSEEQYRGAIYLRFDWQSTLRASSDILTRTIGVILIGISLMGLLAYWLIRRTVLKPMGILAGAAQQQKDGQENARVPALGDDEIGRLGKAFNAMLDSVLERDRRIRTVVNNLPVAINLKDRDGRLVLTNLTFDRWFGEHQARGPRPNDEAKNAERHHKEHAVTVSGKAITWEETCHTEESAARAYVSTVFPIFNAANEIYAVGTVSTDITERKRDEEDLRRLSTAVESASNGILIADATHPDNPIVYANPAVEQLTGYRPEEFLGRNPRFLHGGERDQAGLEQIRTAIRKQTGCRTVVRNYKKDGSVFWNDFTLSPVFDSDDKLRHFIGIQSDITDRRTAEAKIHTLAFFDSLTKIPNRTLFQDRLQQTIKHAERVKKQLGLLFLDLDDFKIINDTLGHDAGDRLLQAVAQRIQACVRRCDTVARMGGDEFTIIVSDLDLQDTTATLTKIAEKILHELSEPIRIDQHELYITTSIGITQYPRDGRSVEELVKNADTAMYHSKAQGRNSYRFFQAKLDRAARRRQRIETQLRLALKREELTLNYQPLIDVATGDVCGVEVLLRWANAELGLVQPKIFVPAAEATGDIVDIGDWVLRQACKQYVSWHNAGNALRRLSVNLSPRQFREATFVARVKQALDDTGIDPSAVQLEVTEGSIIHDPETAAEMLRDLKSLGLHIAMDDFGTGYSSLRYLRELPIDVVKIDRSFIANLPADPKDVEIVTAIIAMARGLRLEVVAEGVETAEQLKLLTDLGCDTLQGFHYCMPLSKEGFSQWLAKSDAQSAGLGG